MEINLAKLKEKTVKAITDKLWGTDDTDAALMSPDELIELIITTEAAA